VTHGCTLSFFGFVFNDSLEVSIHAACSPQLRRSLLGRDAHRTAVA
jgi:hypothetical protein